MPDLPIRSADEIAASEVEYFAGATTQITDLSVGSVTRTLLEANAIEQSHLEVAVALASNAAIEQSSYTTFGFSRAQPTPATGDVIFQLQAGATGTITIPAGTQVRVPGINLKVYQTVESQQVVLTGSPTDPTQVTCKVVATVAGSSGNAQAGTITQITTPVNGIASVNNLQAFFNGTDLETDAERRQRFAQFIRSIQRATESAILTGALSTRIVDDFGYVTDEVRKVNTIENTPNTPDAASTPPNPANPPPGNVWIYVHNGFSTPTTDLVAACQQVINGWEDLTVYPPVVYPGFKAAGIVATVYPAEEIEVPVSLTYDIDVGYLPAQVEPAIEQAINTYFQNLNISGTLVVQQLQRAVIAVPGVLDFQLTTPSSNVTSAYNQFIIPGELDIEQNIS